MKIHDSLSQLDDGDTDVLQKSLIDTYPHRPQSLNLMCLVEFAAKYAVKCEYDNEEYDSLSAPESDTTSTQISLTDGFGK